VTQEETATMVGVWKSKVWKNFVCWSSTPFRVFHEHYYAIFQYFKFSLGGKSWFSPWIPSRVPDVLSH